MGFVPGMKLNCVPVLLAAGMVTSRVLLHTALDGTVSRTAERDAALDAAALIGRLAALVEDVPGEVAAALPAGSLGPDDERVVARADGDGGNNVNHACRTIQGIEGEAGRADRIAEPPGLCRDRPPLIRHVGTEWRKLLVIPDAMGQVLADE